MSRSTSGATGMQEKSIWNTDPAQLCVGLSCVSLRPRGLQTSKGQALRGPRSCRLRPAPQTGPQSQSPLAVCGSAEGDLSPNAERPPTGIFLSLSFFPFIRLTYPPPSASGCLKTVWESCFWLSLHPQHPRCLFPKQFFHLTKRQYDLYFLFHFWLTVTMVSCRHVLVQTQNTGTWFFSSWCLVFNPKIFLFLIDELNIKKGRRSQSRETSSSCSGVGKMASISL